MRNTKLTNFHEVSLYSRIFSEFFASFHEYWFNEIHINTLSSEQKKFEFMEHQRCLSIVASSFPTLIERRLENIQL